MKKQPVKRNNQEDNLVRGKHARSLLQDCNFLNSYNVQIEMNYFMPFLLYIIVL